MKTARAQLRPPATRQPEGVILFHVGDVTFGIAADALEEIRTVDGMRPLVQPVVPKVRHTFERGGKICYVVDGGFYFQMLPVRSTHLLILRRPGVALLVERIDLMQQISAIHALPRAFTGEERNWYRGLAVLPGAAGEEKLVPVINPEALLTEEEIQRLAPLLRARGGRP